LDNVAPALGASLQKLSESKFKTKNPFWLIASQPYTSPILHTPPTSLTILNLRPPAFSKENFGTVLEEMRIQEGKHIENL
jgi:hypothetical protein